MVISSSGIGLQFVLMKVEGTQGSAPYEILPATHLFRLLFRIQSNAGFSIIMPPSKNLKNFRLVLAIAGFLLYNKIIVLH